MIPRAEIDLATWPDARVLVFVDGQNLYNKVLPGFSVTHQITPDVFDLVRDDTDYTVSADKWVPPILPRALADILADRKAEAVTEAPDANAPEEPTPPSN